MSVIELRYEDSIRVFEVGSGELCVDPDVRDYSSYYDVDVEPYYALLYGSIRLSHSYPKDKIPTDLSSACSFLHEHEGLVMLKLNGDIIFNSRLLSTQPKKQ